MVTFSLQHILLYPTRKGLGKHGEGRVEPVEIRILPAGKSLDVCAELREAGKIRRGPGEEGKGGRKRKRRKLVDVSGLEQAKVSRSTVFVNLIYTIGQTFIVYLKSYHSASMYAPEVTY